jgi:hypothetical protein
MSCSVPDKISFPSKSGVAMFTNELFDVRMHLLVLTQSPFPLETFSTSFANKRFDIRMRWHVLLQLEYCHEGHVADFTLKLCAVNLYEN